jgi:hypothetical protein
MARQKQMVSKMARQKQMVSKMSGNPSVADAHVRTSCHCVTNDSKAVFQTPTKVLVIHTASTLKVVKPRLGW